MNTKTPYYQFCKLATEDVETYKSFKRNDIYNIYMEHVTMQQGVGYIKEIEKIINKYTLDINFDLLIKNDMIGLPRNYHYKINGVHVNVSPTTLRFIKQGLDILIHIKKTKDMIGDVNIVEIGGGYGGLCYILHVLSLTMDVKINKYVMYDSFWPLVLQHNYLDEIKQNLDYNPNVEFNEYTDDLDVGLNYYLVSNFTLSELNTSLQNKLISAIKAKHGYLTWSDYTLPLFSTFQVVVDELPQTGIYNKTITF